MVWRIFIHLEKDNAIIRAKIPFSLCVCRKSFLSFNSSISHVLQVLLGADKGAWVEHKEDPAGKDSLESHWIRGRLCHLPLDCFIFNRGKPGIWTLHIAPNLLALSFPPPPPSYLRQPRQLFQVMQVQQSNQDLYSTISTTSVTLLGWIFCSPPHVWEISTQKLYLSQAIN